MSWVQIDDRLQTDTADNLLASELSKNEVL